MSAVRETVAALVRSLEEDADALESVVKQIFHFFFRRHDSSWIRYRSVFLEIVALDKRQRQVLGDYELSYGAIAEALSVVLYALEVGSSSAFVIVSCFFVT